MAVALTRMTLPMLGGLVGTACMGEGDMRNNRNSYGLEGIVALDSNNLYHNIVVNLLLQSHYNRVDHRNPDGFYEATHNFRT